jgi:hypothetical protein
MPPSHPSELTPCVRNWPLLLVRGPLKFLSFKATARRVKPQARATGGRRLAQRMLHSCAITHDRRLHSEDAMIGS